MKLRFALVILSLFSVSAHAGLNKWVDVDGTVHYSDTIPPDVDKSHIVQNMSGKGASAVTYAPKSVAEREAELKKAKQEKEDSTNKKAQEAAQTEEKKRNCSTAQQNLRTLEEGGRMVTYDEKGERTFLDDAGREQRLNDARKAISTNCN